MVAWAKGACDDFFRVPKFLVLFASKSTARTTTKRIYNNRSKVSCIEEHKTDVYPHFYVITRSIPQLFTLSLKTKQGKRDSVLVSYKGTPNRDGRAKRCQSLIQMEKGSTWNSEGFHFYAYNFAQFKKEKIVIFHHPSEQYLDFEILRYVTLRSRMTMSNEFSLQE